jgi:hypothetical protein
VRERGKESRKEKLKEPEIVRLQAVGACNRVTACLVHNEPTSYLSLASLSTLRYGGEAKASLNRVNSKWE